MPEEKEDRSKRFLDTSADHIHFGVESKPASQEDLDAMSSEEGLVFGDTGKGGKPKKPDEAE